MEIKLICASVKDAKRLWEMQVEAFTEMYKTYQDTETSPAAESNNIGCCKILR